MGILRWKNLANHLTWRMSWIVTAFEPLKPLSGANKLMHQEEQNNICLVIPAVRRITVSMQSCDVKEYCFCCALLGSESCGVAGCHQNRKRSALRKADICTKQPWVQHEYQEHRGCDTQRARCQFNSDLSTSSTKRTPITRGSTSSQSKSNPLEGG